MTLRELAAATTFPSLPVPDIRGRTLLGAVARGPPARGGRRTSTSKRCWTARPRWPPLCRPPIWPPTRRACWPHCCTPPTPKLGASGMHVFMPYADRLRAFAYWVQQLWAESLGKALDRAGAARRDGAHPGARLRRGGPALDPAAAHGGSPRQGGRLPGPRGAQARTSRSRPPFPRTRPASPTWAATPSSVARPGAARDRRGAPARGPHEHDRHGRPSGRAFARRAVHALPDRRRLRRVRSTASIRWTSRAWSWARCSPMRSHGQETGAKSPRSPRRIPVGVSEARH